MCVGTPVDRGPYDTYSPFYAHALRSEIDPDRQRGVEPVSVYLSSFPGESRALLPRDHDLARLSGVEDLVGLFCLGEREGVGHRRLGVKSFAGEVLQKLSHLEDPANP